MRSQLKNNQKQSIKLTVIRKLLESSTTLQRYMRLLLIIICFFSCSAEQQTGKVVKVIDGDTFDLMLDKTIRVRIFGIDSPERGQAYNVKAKEFTAVEGERLVEVCGHRSVASHGGGEWS